MLASGQKFYTLPFVRRVCERFGEDEKRAHGLYVSKSFPAVDGKWGLGKKYLAQKTMFEMYI